MLNGEAAPHPVVLSHAASASQATAVTCTSRSLVSRRGFCQQACRWCVSARPAAPTWPHAAAAAQVPATSIMGHHENIPFDESKRSIGPNLEGDEGIARGGVQEEVPHADWALRQLNLRYCTVTNVAGVMQDPILSSRARCAGDAGDKHSSRAAEFAVTPGAAPSDMSYRMT